MIARPIAARNKRACCSALLALIMCLTGSTRGAAAAEEAAQPLREAVERCEVIVVAEVVNAVRTGSEDRVPTIEYDLRVMRPLKGWASPLVTYTAVYYHGWMPRPDVQASGIEEGLVAGQTYIVLSWHRNLRDGKLEILRAEPVARILEVVAFLRTKLQRQQSTREPMDPMISQPGSSDRCLTSTSCVPIERYEPPVGDVPAKTLIGCRHLLAPLDKDPSDGSVERIPEFSQFWTACACDRVEGQCRLLDQVYPYSYTCRIISVHAPGYRSGDRIVTFEVAQGEQAGKQFTARVRLADSDGLLDSQGRSITVRLRVNRKLKLDNPQQSESVQPDEIAWEHVERVDAR